MVRNEETNATTKFYDDCKEELEKFPVGKSGTCSIQYHHIEYGNITGNWYTPQEAYD